MRSSREVWLAGWLLLAGGTATAQGPPSVYEAARQGVVEGRLKQTRMAGFSIEKTPFREAPGSGVLVGFEVGLGKFLRDEVVYALRPIYRDEEGEFHGGTHGLFHDLPGAGPAGRGSVERTVSLRARPGYAVGAVSLRTGLYINGLSVTFRPVNGRTLDARDSYTSAWVGSQDKGKPATLDAGEAPVVGVFGNRDDRCVLALGLIYLDGPALAPPAPEPAVEPDPPAPAPEPEVGEERAEGREEAAPAAPASPPPAAAAANPSGGSGLALVPVFVFAMVTVPAVFLIFVVSAAVKRHARPAPPDETLDLPAGPAPPAPSLPPADAGGICTRPASKPELRWAEARPEAGLCQRPLPQVVAAPEGEGPPRYFTARATFHWRRNRLYRVYLLPDELLFLQPAKGPGPPVGLAVAAGLMGGLLGALVVGLIHEGMRDKARLPYDELDECDYDELRWRAAHGKKHDFRATADDLCDVRIEPKSLWHSVCFPNNPHEALLRFRHRELGAFTLELLTHEDVRLAVEHLPCVLGDGVVIDRGLRRWGILP